MSAIPDPIRVSVVLTYRADLPYDNSEFGDGVAAAFAQDEAEIEVIVVDHRGRGARADFLPGELRSDRRVIRLPGTYPNRAAGRNAAMRRASGAYVLFVDNEAGCVRLRRSAVRALVLAAARHPNVGLVYADYDRRDGGGRVTEVHLLDYHAGRVRDNLDLGPVILCPAMVLESVGGLDERYAAADAYDLRLRISEHYALVHVGNRTGGSLYEIAAEAKRTDVFDYVLSARDVQAECERALTEHLRRIGALLAADRPAERLEYTPEEARRFRACLASVVIPVNDRPAFIGRAIESVWGQTVRDIEAVVVVNGGPDDPTVAAVGEYQSGGRRFRPDRPPVRLIVLDVNNIGLSLNAGIDAAAGKYYVQLDSDDRLKPDAVEKLIAVFDADPHVGMVIGAYEVWELDEASGELTRRSDLPVVRHEEWTDDNGPNNLLRINGAGAPRAAHMKAIRAVGGFGLNDSPHSRNYGEDYDLVLRISERFRIGRVWDPIYEVVRHAGGTDHAIDRATVDRNDEAKDHMRLEAVRRRQVLNGINR